MDALLLTIDTLKSEIKFLREEIRTRDDQLSSVLTLAIRDSSPQVIEAETPIAPSTPIRGAERLCSEVDSPTRTVQPTRSLAPKPFPTSNRFEAPSESAVEVDSPKSAVEVDSKTQTAQPPRAARGNAPPLRSWSPEPIATSIRYEEKLFGFEVDTPSQTAPLSKSPSATKKQFPKVRMKKPLVAVIGDSMLKRLSSYELSQCCREVNSFVRPFIGATVEEMHDYLIPVLRKKPDVVVLHIGTNDLNDPQYDGEQTLINKLNDLLVKIQNTLPNVIIIMSLPTIRRDQFFGRVRNFNIMLANYCRENLINFISNENINCNHLNKGGLHLNIDGSKILSSNITSFINFIISHCFPY